MSSLKTHAYNFWRYRYLLQDLVNRDIKVKYRRSVLGIVWSVLNPLLMMLVTTLVFSHLFRFEVEFFAVFFLTGSLIFNFMATATGDAMTSILGSAGLIKKVYIPKYIFPLEKCVFALVNVLFSLIALFGVIIFVGMPIPWTIVLLPIPIFLTFIFSVGLGLILATLAVFFRDITHLYSVLIQAWMFLTPVIYPVEILPIWLRQLMVFNPMYRYVSYFRDVTMYGVVPGMQENLNSLGFALVFLVLGMAVYRWKQHQLVLHM